jgi:hypothetical protein
MRKSTYTPQTHRKGRPPIKTQGLKPYFPVAQPDRKGYSLTGKVSPDDFRIISGRIYNRRKKAVSNATGSNQYSEVKPQIDVQPTSAIVASELGVSKATIERKKTIQDLYLKCYTAEEIGGVVGLEKRQTEMEVSALCEDVRKVREVTFSEPDYAPPIYNSERKEQPC